MTCHGVSQFCIANHFALLAPFPIVFKNKTEPPKLLGGPTPKQALHPANHEKYNRVANGMAQRKGPLQRGVAG